MPRCIGIWYVDSKTEARATKTITTDTKPATGATYSSTTAARTDAG